MVGYRLAKGNVERRFNWNMFVLCVSPHFICFPYLINDTDGTVGFELHCAPGAIVADFSRLSSANPDHPRGIRDLTRYGYKDLCKTRIDYGCSLTKKIPEPIVFWFEIFGFVRKYVNYCSDHFDDPLWWAVSLACSSFSGRCLSEWYLNPILS